MPKNKNLEKQDFHVDKSNPSEELVKIPSTNALLKGTATGPAAKEMKPADQWPTEKIADVSMEKKLVISKSPRKLRLTKMLKLKQKT